MKKMIHTMIAGSLLTLFSITAIAQDSKPATPKWVSDKGYWVVESNVRDPFSHVIRFYNNEDVMIYKETLSGVKLNLNRKKVKVKLTRVLETSALAWNQRKTAEEEKAYVSAILK